MTSNEQDDQDRRDTSPNPTGSGTPGYGQQSSYGQEQQYGSQQPQYGQQYGSEQPQYGQQYSGQQYGSSGQPPAAYGEYGQQQPAQYGGYGYPAASGGYGQYGESGIPAKPAAVTIAAVLGFIWGALGALMTLLFFFGAAAVGGAAGGGELDSAIPGFSEIAGAAAGIFAVFGVLALAWTVLMILGSVRALSGRSRVPLIVGGSIAIAATGLAFFGSLGDSTSGVGSVIFSLLLFAGSIAIVVLLCLKPAAAFFNAHRARRAVR